MKKVLSIILMALVVTAVFVSCDNHKHTYSAEWKSDANSHWHECTCGAKDEEAAHSFGGNTVKDGKVFQICSVCGYEKEISDATIVSDVSSLSEALKGDKTIVLANDITLSETLPISKSITLDLGGKTIKSKLRAFHVKSGTLTVQNGTIESTITDQDSSVIRLSDKDSTGTDIGLVVEADAVINGLTSYGISAFGKSDATITIYGTVNSANPCVAGYGGKKDWNTGKITVNVKEGAKLTAYGATLTSKDGDITAGEVDKKYDDACGIYQPNVGGTLNIEGGTITSNVYSAIEVRNGNANISGGTLVSKASSYEVGTTPSGGGPCVKGAAVAVNYYGTGVDTDKAGITVTISGGTFTAEKQLALVNGSSDATIKAVVSDGVLDENKIVGTITKGENNTWTVTTK